MTWQKNGKHQVRGSCHNEQLGDSHYSRPSGLSWARVVHRSYFPEPDTDACLWLGLLMMVMLNVFDDLDTVKVDDLGTDSANQQWPLMHMMVMVMALTVPTT